MSCLLYIPTAIAIDSYDSHSYGSVVYPALPATAHTGVMAHKACFTICDEQVTSDQGCSTDTPSAHERSVLFARRVTSHRIRCEPSNSLTLNARRLVHDAKIVQNPVCIV